MHIYSRMIHHWLKLVSLLSDWRKVTVFCCCVAVCYQTTSEFFHRNGNLEGKDCVSWGVVMCVESSCNIMQVTQSVTIQDKT